MLTITPASPADIPAVARTLGSAFQADTVMATLVSPSNPVHGLARLFHAILRSGALRHGRVDVARQDDGEILAAAIWQTPGRSISLVDEARELPLFLRALGPLGIFKAARLQRTLDRHRPAEPHWYLAQIGATPNARGSGAGSALLEHRLAIIDDAGEPAYLESSNERNRKLYRRFGFTTMSILDTIPDASPARMWRPASASGQRPGVQ